MLEVVFSILRSTFTCELKQEQETTLNLAEGEKGSVYKPKIFKAEPSLLFLVIVCCCCCFLWWLLLFVQLSSRIGGFQRFFSFSIFQYVFFLYFVDKYPITWAMNNFVRCCYSIWFFGCVFHVIFIFIGYCFYVF